MKMSLEILKNVKLCIDGCVGVGVSDHTIFPVQVKAIGITNQRETTVVWNKHTGTPLYNAIVWQDTRTQSTCDTLRATHDSERVRYITGLPISTYFSGVKLRWLIDHVPAVRKAIQDGSALFGTIDSWLVWNLSSERAHVTDVTNAGRTMLMNIRSLAWDDEMLSMIGVTRDILPEIRSCSESVGQMQGTILKGVPISGIIGDQQAALVGQSCFEVGEAKSTYGTGCFLIVNTGEEAKESHNGLLTTPGYKLGANAPCVYSLEGSVAVAGSAVIWLRDSMNIIGSASESEKIARTVDDTGDVYVVPAFTGLYAPWWREDARGTIVGMTQFTQKAHVVRATLESVAFQVNAVLQAASEDMGNAITELKVDGGMTQNELVMQMQADITNITVVRPSVIETTALGACFCAGHAVGLYGSMDAFRDSWKLDKRFEPRIDDETREQKLQKWETAVQCSLGWVDKTVQGKSTKSWVYDALDKVSQDLIIGIAVGATLASMMIVKTCGLSFKK